MGFAMGFTGCTSSSGTFELFRAEGLCFGSGRSKGSSTGFVGCVCLTRRGRLDCARVSPARLTVTTARKRNCLKYPLFIKNSPGERVCLRFSGEQRNGMFSDALQVLLVRLSFNVAQQVSCDKPKEPITKQPH